MINGGTLPLGKVPGEAQSGGARVEICCGQGAHSCPAWKNMLVWWEWCGNIIILMVILALGLLNQGWLTSIIPKDSNFEALSDQKAPGRQLASLRVRGGFRFGFSQVVMGFGFAARALAARTKRWKSRRACDRPKRCNACAAMFWDGFFPPRGDF